jgi:diguanylate cyclase (GGDEF)-like protein/PAS domain S-box-containing protein
MNDKKKTKEKLINELAEKRQRIAEMERSEVEIKRVEEELKKKTQLLDAATDSIFVFDFDGNFIYLNEAAYKSRGYSKDELMGMNLRDLDVPGHVELSEQLIKNLMEKGEVTFESAHFCKDKSIMPIEVHARIIESDYKKMILSVARNISKRKRAEKALSWEVEVNTAMAELSRALLSPVSIEDISSLVLEYAKNLTGSIFGFVGYIDPETGYLVSPTLTRDIWDECRVKDKDIVFKKFTGLWGWVLDNKKPLLTNTPASDPRSSGIPSGHVSIDRFLSVPALLGETLVGQVALANSVHDYTDKDLALVERMAAVYAIAFQRKRDEETIRQLAYHDALTGLPNRLLFNDRLTIALAQANRNEEKLAVMLLDLDNFKNVNDTLGHSMGDRLLKGVADRLTGVLRKADTVARMGGDEFMLLMPGITRIEYSVEIAYKVLQTFYIPFVIDGHEIHTSASIGIAIYPDDGEDTDTLIKNADIAMYHAKEQGRNKYFRYSPYN